MADENGGDKGAGCGVPVLLFGGAMLLGSVSAGASAGWAVGILLIGAAVLAWDVRRDG